MGEHSRGQGQGPAFSRSAYGIPFHESWGSSWSGAASASSIRSRQAPGPLPEDAQIADPARADFWARRGAGYRLLVVIAAAHVGAGLLGAIASALTWFLARPAVVLPALAAVLAALVAVSGAVAFELARSWGPRAASAARLLLPAVDLAAAAMMLWLLGDSALTVLLFVPPALVAALLFSWRSGTVFAAIGGACFAAMNALLPSLPLDRWATETLALAGVLAAIVLGVGVYAAVMNGVQAGLRAEIAQLRRQRETQAAEQQRLLETLNLLEDAQARLERERVQVNQQIAEVAGTVYRLVDGDQSAIHALKPGMFGPLESVRVALGRMTLRLGMGTGSPHGGQEQRRAIEAALDANRDQSQLLAAADTALRTLGASANELVAEVQVVERGSGELPGIDRHKLFQVLRSVEQRALAQASNTAFLGARFVQLRTRQSELEVELQRLNRLSQSKGSRQEWEHSGLHTWPAEPPTGRDWFQQGGMGETGDVRR